ncbi:MAG TPA: NAD(P)H-dependent oxidoreductase [Spirochaetia bacterium]|nr:NAD(P)H-dependent oxidoreductase [Spirochaetia bacterium]
MKIVVLNGSPKGDVSVTRQYVLHLEKAFPQHAFEILHVAQQSRKLEHDAAAFEDVLQKVRSADGILWAFPLYFLLVSSQYKRFIDLLWTRGADSAFRGKHAATLSTSIHYYDSNAHTYMRSICEDLGMKFVGMHSAEMHDLTREDERRRLRLFAQDFFTSIERALEFPRLSVVLPNGRASYRPSTPVRTVDSLGRNIVILTDAAPQDESLRAMTARLSEAWEGSARTVNLHDLDIKGGCQGCLRCGAACRCAYTGKDGFIEFYNTVLKPADVIVFSGSIIGRQLSWKWREFFDRSFFNTHTPSLVGKQIAFVVSGPLSFLPELRETYEAWVELQQSNLAGFISDEGEVPDAPAPARDAALDQLAERLVRFSEASYVRPPTFLGVAGMKIFRDDIWSDLRVVFRADHKAYRQRGLYDFPQRRVGHRILIGLASFLTGLPGIRSRFPSMIRTQMIVPMHRAALKGVS